MGQYCQQRHLRFSRLKYGTKFPEKVVNARWRLRYRSATVQVLYLKLCPISLTAAGFFHFKAIEVVVGREDGEADNGVVRVKAESQSAVKIQTSE